MNLNKKLIFGIAISALIIAYLLSKTNFLLLLQLFDRISWPLVLATFAVYVLILAMRTVRFKVMLKTPIAFFDLFKIVSVYALLMNVLPLKTGEVSYIFLAKQNTRLKTGERVASWLVARMFDLISLSLIFLSVYFLLRPNNAVINAAMLIVLAILAVLISGLLFLFIYGTHGLVIVRRILKAMRLHNLGLSRYAIKKAQATLTGLAYIRSTRKILAVLFYSIIIWLLHTSFFFLLLRSLGIDGLSFADCIIILLISGLILLIPIQGIANIGTFEASTTIAFVSLGIATDKAITYSIGVHILQIAFYLIAGVSGILLMVSTRPKQKRVAEDA